MKTLLRILVLLLPASLFADAVELAISLDLTVSSDTATICRVVAVNHSGHTLQGSRIGFEARAIERGVVVAAERGRFGGSVPDGASVETLIGFTGVFRDFSVSSAAVGRSGSRKKSKGKSGGKPRSRKRH
jgi:hypothetical protein